MRTLFPIVRDTSFSVECHEIGHANWSYILFYIVRLKLWRENVYNFKWRYSKKMLFKKNVKLKVKNVVKNSKISLKRSAKHENMKEKELKKLQMEMRDCFPLDKSWLIARNLFSLQSGRISCEKAYKGIRIITAFVKSTKIRRRIAESGWKMNDAGVGLCWSRLAGACDAGSQTGAAVLKGFARKQGRPSGTARAAKWDADRTSERELARATQSGGLKIEPSQTAHCRQLFANDKD